MDILPSSPGLCGAVVLAAGEARRFGAPKLLMPFGNSTVLGSVIEVLISAHVEPVVVVAGANRPAIEGVLRDSPAQVVCNLDPGRGMLSSVQVGVAALPGDLDRFLIALGDQPRIRAEGVLYLIREHARSGKGIALPAYEGRRGHPIILSSVYREEILALTGEQTLRDLILAHQDDCLEIACDSDAVLCDIDTREEYENELRRLHAEQQRDIS